MGTLVKYSRVYSGQGIRYGFFPIFNYNSLEIFYRFKISFIYDLDLKSILTCADVMWFCSTWIFKIYLKRY